MLERAVVALGCLIGLGAGLVFYLTADHLRLPALLFVIVDLFGVVPGSIIVGLFSTPVAIGVLVLLCDRVLGRSR